MADVGKVCEKSHIVHVVNGVSEALSVSRTAPGAAAGRGLGSTRQTPWVLVQDAPTGTRRPLHHIPSSAASIFGCIIYCKPFMGFV